MDHFIPVKNAVAGQQVVWRALCKPCHAVLSERSGGRKNPILSSFNTHRYEVFVKSAKPQPATFKANKIDKSPLVHLDIKRCRANILKHSEWEWCVACAADELVKCTVENCYSLDFVFVEGRELKTASR